MKSRRVSFERRSQSVGAHNPVEDKARNPNCARLEGFTCKLPKGDLTQAAKDFLAHFQLEDKFVNIHAGNVAGSCVIEFETLEVAKKAIDLSREAKVNWAEPDATETHPLFLSWDESEESRALGRALHFAYDAAAASIIPHCPAGSRLNTDKTRGLLNVVVGHRFHTVICIEIDTGNEGQYHISGPRKNGSFKLPSYITEDMIDTTIAKAKKEPIFN